MAASAKHSLTVNYTKRNDTKNFVRFQNDVNEKDSVYLAKDEVAKMGNPTQIQGVFSAR